MTDDQIKDLKELNDWEESFLIPRKEILKSLYDIKSRLDSRGCHSGETDNKIQEAIMWLELDIKNNESGIDFQKQRIGAL